MVVSWLFDLSHVLCSSCHFAGCVAAWYWLHSQHTCMRSAVARSTCWSLMVCSLCFPNFFFFFFFFFSRYSLFAIAFLLSSPVPVLLCRGSSDPFADEQSSLPDLGFFLTGFLATSGIALPAVLLGGGVIVYQTLIMSIAGSLVCGIAVVILLKFVLGGGSGSQEMF
jgi:hypothetical protein